MKFNFRKQVAFGAFLLFVAVILAGCAGPKKQVRVIRDPSQYFREHGMASLPRFDMPIEVNERVIAWIEYFQGAGRKHFERYLTRSGKYIPMMQRILREEGLPQDLVYISMIESGFSPHAKSSASAVGLWQFMKPTGAMYGLKVDGFVDDRRDPYKATRAAARHFKDLYNDTGDWYLAMVGYNAGPGRVTKARALSGSNNFWDMANHRTALRAETRDYVPKFVAAAIISKMPERFGFEKVDYQDPLDFETRTIDSQTDFKVLAECAGVDEDTIKDLNPHLYRGVTPPTSSFEIRLPRGTGDKFQQKFASLPPNERMKTIRYAVRKGDTIQRIAKKYGVSVDAIVASNDVNTKKRLKRGTVLIIPTGSAAAAFASNSNGDDDSASSAKSSKVKKLVYHRVKKGETLSSIASRFGVKSSQILAWNGLGRRSNVRVGTKLKIYEPVAIESGSEKVASNSKKSKVDGALKDTTAVKLGSSSENIDASEPSTAASSEKVIQTYVVKKGETLGTIASKNNMTLKELMQVNKITNAKKVRAGSKIKVKREGGAVAMDKTASAKQPSQKSPPPSQPSPKPTTTSKPAPTDFAASGSTTSGQPVKLGSAAPIQSSQTNAANPENSLQAIANSSQQNATAYGAATSAQQSVAKQPPKEVASAGSPVKLGGAASAPTKQSASSAKSTATKSAGAKLTYQVKDGDTLWDIARKHKVSISEIQQWNNLSDQSTVKPGMKLSIKQ